MLLSIRRSVSGGTGRRGTGGSPTLMMLPMPIPPRLDVVDPPRVELMEPLGGDAARGSRIIEKPFPSTVVVLRSF